MKRFYHRLVIEHLKEHRQMLLLMGPRQVGKTTLCQALEEEWPRFHYFTWDEPDGQALVVEGPRAVAEEAALGQLASKAPLLVCDEIHKYRRWKLFLKGLYDTYPSQGHIVVTGSARLDVYQRGGDSLMGRYFAYRIHPCSVAEILDPDGTPEELRDQPRAIDEAAFEALWRFGGFPDPLLKANDKYYRRWTRTRYQQLFKEDIRDLSRVQELAQFELLAELLRYQVGQLTSYTSLAKRVRISDPTIRNWLKILGSVYYCFEVRPWHKNVGRSLRKEPKYYRWDWSLCKDEGQRAENFIASHLLKAVHFWTDHGLGDYRLHYVRDKEKREVDFLIVRDGNPWMLIEVKKNESRTLSPSLYHFAAQLRPEYVFQVVIDLPYVDKPCFIGPRPIIVPARTFLSQLV